MTQPLSIAVIDYEGGNLASAARAAVRASELSGLAAAVVVTNEPSEVRRADRIILPGQGPLPPAHRGWKPHPA